MENFFWGGKFSPQALFIGAITAPKIPEGGLPCRFFISKKGGWCFDLSTTNPPHRLYAEYYRSGWAGSDIKPQVWNFFSDIKVVEEWVLATKVARSNGGGEGVRYTIVKNGVTPEEIKGVILERITQKKSSQINTRVVTARGRYSSQHDFCRGDWQLSTDGHRCAQGTILGTFLDGVNNFLPEKWNTHLAGWFIASPVHEHHHYFLVSEEVARKNGGFLVFIGEDGLYHSRRASEV